MAESLASRQFEQLEPKIARRLERAIVGELLAVASCLWKGKPAAVGHTENDLGFVSSGISGRAAASEIHRCSLVMKTPTTAVLAVAGCSFDIEFPSASVAQDLADSIKATMDATSSRRSGPPWIGEHERLVRSCIYLGGAYLPLQSGVAVDLIFREGALEIFNHPATFRSAPLYEIAYGPEFAIETSGPGKVTKGGGFIGGGFGLVGAVEGMAIAGLLNAITTRTSIVTVLTVADNKHEAFFVTSAMVPEDLRRGLSPVFVRLRQYRQPELSPAVTAMPTADDLVSKLERLGALRASAVLTDDEFVAAKAALLAGHFPGGAELSG